MYKSQNKTMRKLQFKNKTKQKHFLKLKYILKNHNKTKTKMLKMNYKNNL